MNEGLGYRIRKIRESRNETMEEFGINFNPPASKGVVSNWENGYNKPNKKRLDRIAELGNITLNELLYGSEMTFKEFSRQVYEGDRDLIEWCQKVITDYFLEDTKKGTMDSPLSNKKELNLLMSFNIIDILFEKDEYPRIEAFKNNLLPIIWDYFINKEFEEYLNSLYLYYVEDEIALYMLDSTFNEILQNISLENKLVYLLNIKELIESTTDQFKYSNFHVKKSTLDTTEKIRIPIITMDEYEEIRKGLYKSLNYIDLLIEKESNK